MPRCPFSLKTKKSSIRFKEKQQTEGNVSGGKLTRVRNERSLEEKKYARSKPKDDDKEGEERPMADAATTKV